MLLMNNVMVPDVVHALALLPWWVYWGPLVIVLPTVFVFSFIVTRIAQRITVGSIRALENTHWTVRASAIYPYRMTHAGLMVALPSAFVFGYGHLGAWNLPFSYPFFVVVSVLIIWCGVACAASTDRLGVARHNGLFVWWFRLRLQFAVGFIVPLVIVVCMSITRQWPMTLFCVASFAMVNLSIWGSGLLLGRMLGYLRFASGRVVDVVRQACLLTRQKLPRVYVFNAACANAFAIPMAQTLLVTNRLVALLDDAQLAAIIHHELAHLSESRWMKWLRLFLANLVFGPLIVCSALMAQWGYWGLVMALVICFFGLWLSAVFSRRMERRADAMSAAACNPSCYAMALEKLYEDNLVPVVISSRFKQHPDLYDRMVDVGVTPTYPRPPAPSMRRHRLAEAWTVCACVLMVIGSLSLRQYRDVSHASLLRHMAVNQSDAWDFGQLGWYAWSARQSISEASIFYRAAEALDSVSVYYPANLAVAYVMVGDCPAARAALQRAESRLTGNDSEFVMTTMDSARHWVEHWPCQP